MSTLFLVSSREYSFKRFIVCKITSKHTKSAAAIALCSISTCSESQISNMNMIILIQILSLPYWLALVWRDERMQQEISVLRERVGLVGLHCLVTAPLLPYWCLEVDLHC